MKYNYLYTSDSNYYNYMYLSIYSLLKNNDYPLTVHIIESGFTKEQYEKLERLFSLYKNATFKTYSIDKLKHIMEKFSIPKWRGSEMANARLFSSELIDVDKILYIDCDTIVSASLKDVFDTNENSPVSAVREFDIPNHMKDKVTAYYNAGILLFNYQICHKIDFIKLLFDAVNTSIPLVYPDQDLLNFSLKEELGTLLPSYNVNPMVYDMIFKYLMISKEYLKEREDNFYFLEELVSSYQNPCIYHLLDYVHARPWIKNNIHPFNKIYDIYAKEAFGKIEKQDSDNIVDLIIRNVPLSSTLSIILQVMPYSEQLDIKGKIRNLIYHNRK